MQQPPARCFTLCCRPHVCHPPPLATLKTPSSPPDQTPCPPPSSPLLSSHPPPSSWACARWPGSCILCRRWGGTRRLVCHQSGRALFGGREEAGFDGQNNKTNGTLMSKTNPIPLKAIHANHAKHHFAPVQSNCTHCPPTARCAQDTQPTHPAHIPHPPTQHMVHRRHKGESRLEGTRHLAELHRTPVPVTPGQQLQGWAG